MNRNQPFVLITDFNQQAFEFTVTQYLTQGFILYGTHASVFNGQNIIFSQTVVLPQFHPDNLLNHNPRVNCGENKSSKQRKNLY
jgi:hypothetical protein